MGKHLDFTQQAELFRILTEVCSTDENGFAVYEKGWSDRAISEKIGAGSPTAVANRRVKLFGRLRAGGNTTDQQEIARRVEQVEEAITLHDSMLTALRRRIQSLEAEFDGQ